MKTKKMAVQKQSWSDWREHYFGEESFFNEAIVPGIANFVLAASIGSLAIALALLIAIARAS